MKLRLKDTKVVTMIMVAVIITMLCFAIHGCSSKSSSGGSTTDSTTDTSGGAEPGKVVLSGTVGSGYTIAKAKPVGFFAKLFTFAKDAYAATSPTVDRILAVSFNQSNMIISEATFTNNAFSLSVDKNYPQLLVFLNGTTTIGTYKVDSTTDLDTFPLQDSLSTNIDLGTVSYDQAARKMSGTLTTTNLLAKLGVDQVLAKAFGLMDNGLMLLSSLDVDGNNVIDLKENKYFSFSLAYSLNSSEHPADMVGTYSDPGAVTYSGYSFMFRDNNGTYSSGTNSGLLNWSLATFTTPTALDGSVTWGPNSWSADATSAQLNFGPLFTTPATPPSGTYVINVPYSSGSGTQHFTFNNVASRPIDANLYDVYIPSLKLTKDGNNHVSLIEWQWWKRQSSDGSWIMPADAELGMVLGGNGFALCSFNFECVNGAIGFTSTGSVVPPAQTFALFDVGILYWEKSGFHYGFDWR